MSSAHISVDTVLAIHQLLINRFGGSAGVRDLDILEGILQSPYQTFGGEELYPHIVDKAVHLCVEVIRQHPFVDGNKRVAVALLGALLECHGLYLVDDSTHLYNKIIKLVTHDCNVEEFTQYVHSHLTSSLE